MSTNKGEHVTHSPKNGVVTVHSSIPTMLLNAITAQGFNGEQVLNKAGLNLAQISDENVRVSARQMDIFWRIAVALTKDEALSVDFAQQLMLGSLHGLGFVWATSETLLQAFERLVRYLKVICTAGDVELESTQENLALILKLPVDAQDVFFPSVEGALTLFMQLCRLSYLPDFAPEYVELQRPKPMRSDKLAQFFSCPVHFGKAEHKIVFCKESLNKPLPMSNSQLASANDQVVSAYVDSFEATSVSNIVSTIMLEQLSSQLPTLDSVSTALCLTPRTLQRKLKKEDTSFISLMEQVRCELAINYLLHSHRSVSEIAYLLRFKDPANFTRCFKRLTGQSPTQYVKSCL